MKQFIRVVAWGACLVLFVLWWQLPVINQWQVDRLVDELCAMDGRMKVYEPVPTAADAGAIRIPFMDDRTAADPYYYENETAWIYTEANGFGDIGVRRYQDKLIRAADSRIMAERVVYVRQRVDPANPGKTSLYACPADSSLDDLKRKIFIRGNGSGK